MVPVGEHPNTRLSSDNIKQLFPCLPLDGVAPVPGGADDVAQPAPIVQPFGDEINPQPADIVQPYLDDINPQPADIVQPFVDEPIADEDKVLECHICERPYDAQNPKICLPCRVLGRAEHLQHCMMCKNCLQEMIRHPLHDQFWNNNAAYIKCPWCDKRFTMTKLQDAFEFDCLRFPDNDGRFPPANFLRRWPDHETANKRQCLWDLASPTVPHITNTATLRELEAIRQRIMQVDDILLPPRRPPVAAEQAVVHGDPAAVVRRHQVPTANRMVATPSDYFHKLARLMEQRQPGGITKICPAHRNHRSWH